MPFQAYEFEYENFESFWLEYELRGINHTICFNEDMNNNC